MQGLTHLQTCAVHRHTSLDQLNQRTFASGLCYPNNGIVNLKVILKCTKTIRVGGLFPGIQKQWSHFQPLNFRFIYTMQQNLWYFSCYISYFIKCFHIFFSIANFFQSLCVNLFSDYHLYLIVVKKLVINRRDIYWPVLYIWGFLWKENDN